MQTRADAMARTDIDVCLCLIIRSTMKVYILDANETHGLVLVFFSEAYSRHRGMYDAILLSR